MRFRLTKGKGAVNRFTDSNGVVHYPGDIVNLPLSYKGSPWLEPLEAEPKIEVPSAKLEKITTEAEAKVEDSVPVDANNVPLSPTQKKRHKKIVES